MGIILGLTAAIGWGTGDFLVRGATRRIGSFLSLFYMQFFGLLFILLVTIFSGELQIGIARIDPSTVFFLILTVAIGITGSLQLYQAFATGMLAVVSPIAASYAAITLVLSLLSGEQLTLARAIGVAICLCGVLLSSIERNPKASEDGNPRKGSWHLPPGVMNAVGAAICYGIVFWLMGFHVIPRLGGLFSVTATRFGSVVIALPLLALLLGRSLRPPSKRDLRILLAVGVIDTAAFIAAMIGSSTEQVSIVTVLSSMFSAWTVLLAWIFYKERPLKLQWMGISLIFIGIVLVSIGG